MRGLRVAGRSRAALGWACALVGLAAVASSAAFASRMPEAIREQVTGATYASEAEIGGTRYRCLGAGARKIFTFKIYSVAFCLDAEVADPLVRDYLRVNHVGRSGEDLADALKEDQQFFDALIGARGDKMLILTFQRDIPNERLAKAFRDALKEQMPLENAEKLASLLDRDVKRGESALLHSHGTDLVLELQGSVSKTVHDDPVITERIWRIWLGRDSPTPGIKSSIAGHCVARASTSGP